jgi:hypothetical protein
VDGAVAEDVFVDEPGEDVSLPLPAPLLWSEPEPDPEDEPEPDPDPESLDGEAGDELLEAARESLR